MTNITNINNYNNWKNIQKIEKGFDKCEKYSFSFNDKKYLLKVFNKSELEKKSREYKILSSIQNQSLNIPFPVEFGQIDANNYYFIVTWVEGKTLPEYSLNKNNKVMYNKGRELGEFMTKLHRISILEKNEELVSKNIDKMLNRLEFYKSKNYNMENENLVIDYVKNNISVLKTQPISIIHSDLNENNIVISDEDKLGIIDFGSANINYSYYDFHQVQMYTRFFNIPFSVGIIDSYLKNNKLNENFFESLKIYSAYLSLYKIVWAENQSSNFLIDDMKFRYLTTYNDYEGYSKTIPTWYSDFDRSKLLIK